MGTEAGSQIVFLELNDEPPVNGLKRFLSSALAWSRPLDSMAAG
jgi:hypothetical protein